MGISGENGPREAVHSHRATELALNCVDSSIVTQVPSGPLTTSSFLDRGRLTLCSAVMQRGSLSNSIAITKDSEKDPVAGVDRWIRIWDVRKGIMSYIVHDPETTIDPFPVLAVAIDGDSNWLAILSAKDKVFLWNIPEQRWGPSVDVVVKGRTPAGFFFGFETDRLINSIFVIRHNGLMTELNPEANTAKDWQIHKTPLVCARRRLEKSSSSPTHIVTASKKGCVHIASQSPDSD
ncbi:hypothetical protein BKA65DRAFT_476862 [Rhexocercosporidium sp. MPI-PUGE-AT-0058]|nr:hypothetical protein BKA65DRAFT_476862 [Rhexocercosporidium sp. MPI-PUGE-AT-0058]